MAYKIANAGFSNFRLSKSNCLYKAAPSIMAITVKKKLGSCMFFILLLYATKSINTPRKIAIKENVKKPKR